MNDDLDTTAAFDLTGNATPIENPDGSVDIPEIELDTPKDPTFLENLAETLPISILNELSGDYIELVKKDKEAREKRDKQYEEGLRRTGLGDDAPGGAQFEGASRVVHPLLAEACVDFSARAIKELFPANGPVRTAIEGKVDKKALDRAELKARGMNWQLTRGIPEYRDELEQLLTQTPMGGSQYQKFWVEDGEIRTEFVPIDSIYLPFSATNFYRAPRMTHAQDITRMTFKSRVEAGMYVDIEGIVDADVDLPEETAAKKANDKIEGLDDNAAYNDDGLRRVLEIYTWLELDDDPETSGKKAPYIITIDEYTEDVLSIYRNWNQGDPRTKKLDWFVEYKFIPWRGAYGIGLPHLIGGISAALTGALRALMDSAHINNAATMLKLKGGRVTGQNTSVEVTQVSEIEAPAGVDDVRKIAMPMPFNPPSPVLLQLLGILENVGKSVVSTSMESLSQVGDRTPVGTTMALIEQGSTTYAAIHSRLHHSQQMALEIISRLNRDFPEVLDAVNEIIEEPLTAEDFSITTDIRPVSDPNIFSEAQRYAQYQAIVQLSQDPSVQWDKAALYRIGMKLLKFPFADEVLPPPPDPLRANPVDENVMATKGMPLAAHMDQDHKSHLVTHLLFCTSPMFGASPLMGNPTVPTLVQHCKEHLVMLYDQHAKASIAALGEMGMMPGGDSDEETHKALALADQQLATELQQIMPMLEQAQQIAMQFAPPPPQDPQSVVAEKIGMAEVDRKSKLDQATMAMKQQELGLKGQSEQQAKAFDQQKLALEERWKQMESMEKAKTAEFDRQMEAMRLEAEKQRDWMAQQTEVLKNEADNRQHQITEILKNRDDNETAKIIELMKQQVQEVVQTQAATAQASEKASDQAGMMEIIRQLIEQQQGKDAEHKSILADVLMEIKKSSGPKKIIKDAAGRPIGIGPMTE